MKKKILIGSIIAVVILILVSFSSVVGFQSVKSDPKIESPLFGVRTNRVINDENNVVRSDYIGKGKEIKIHLPKRSNEVISFKKIVKRFQNMDDKSFDKLVNIIINNLRQRADFQNFNNEDIVKSLNQIRNHQDSYIRNQDDSKPITTNLFCTVFRSGAFCWYLGEIFIILMAIMVEVVEEVLATVCWLRCYTGGTLVCKK